MANHKRERLVLWNPGRLISRNPRVVREVMARVTHEMDEDLNDTLFDNTYPPHSAPGSTPAHDTGYLADHTRVQALGRKIVIRTPQYGIWLETGTRYMAPRPFIRPVIHQQREHWQERIQYHKRRVLSGA